jgi:hypothetical protein
LSVALYLDEHVHRAIVLGLRLREIDVITAQEDGRSGASDAELLDRATDLGRSFFTQDDDLLAEARRRQLAGIRFAGLVYAHQLRVTIGGCLRDLEIVAGAMSPDEIIDTVIFLPL